MKGIRKVSLFHILLLSSIVVIVSVAISITWVTIQMSENFFIQRYTGHNSKVISQIKRQLESFHYSVILAIDQIQRSSAVEEALSGAYTQTELMHHLFTVGRQVDQALTSLGAYDVNMIVMGEHDFWYARDSTYWAFNNDDLQDSPLMGSLRESPKKIHYDGDPFELGISSIIIAQSLMNRTTSTRYGAIFISMQSEEFESLYDSHTHEGNHIFIVNDQGEVISSDVKNNENLNYFAFASLIETFNKEQLDFLEVEIAGTRQVVIMEYIPNLDLYLFNVVDRDQMTNGLIDQKALGLIILLITTIALIFNFMVIKILTGTLSKFTKEVSQTSASDFKQYVTVSGTFETKEIATAYNKMLDELHIYLNELMAMQQQKREAELTALHRQINVHFLYNTLATIKLLTGQGKKEAAVAMIHSLTSLLQFTLGDLSEMTTVENEVAALQHYVNINEKRYGHKIRVHFFLTPKIKAQEMPKLMIQPFLENAFAHGFCDKQEGDIKVFIWNDQGNLICEVMDNGDGFDLNKLTDERVKSQSRHHFSGLGIQNVRERIHYCMERLLT